MARLQELLAKKAQLDREIADTQRKEKSAAVDHIKTLMEQYGLTAADFGRRKPGRPAKAAASSPPAASTAATGSPKKRRSKMAGKKVAPKYRNKATGETWSGRGLKPRWLAQAIASGKKITDFAI